MCHPFFNPDVLAIQTACKVASAYNDIAQVYGEAFAEKLSTHIADLTSPDRLPLSFPEAPSPPQNELATQIAALKVEISSLNTKLECLLKYQLATNGHGETTCQAHLNL